MPKITKRVVDAAKPSDKSAFIWDDTLKGFGLLIRPSGVHSFIYQYRTREGRSRRTSIAKVGTITPDKAREIAEGHAATVKVGGDPLDAKAKARDAMTVNQLLDLYLGSSRFKEKAPSTRSIEPGRINRHLRPLLGRSYVHKLTTEDIRRARDAIRDGKTATNEKTGKRGRARVTGGATTARDTIALLRAVLNWAIGEGYIGQNPAQGIKLGSSGRRETILDGKGYERLFAALTRMEADKRIRSAVADAVRVIALTGARRSEIAGLRWRHVDLKAGTITLPPTSHKAGHKTGQSRTIHLPAAAVEIIERQDRSGSDDFVFRPAKGDGGTIALSKPWRAIRKEAKLPEGFGLHGLRHTLASMLAMSGGQASEIQAALGHSTIAMAAKYVHWADSARKTLAERAAAPVLAGLNGGTTPQAGEK